MTVNKNESTSTEKTTSTVKLVNTWDETQIKDRISEIERSLENEGISKSRRKLLFSKISRLRKALNGECIVGGQKEPKKVEKRKINKRQNTTVESRWKVCLCCRGKGHTMINCRKNPSNTGTNKETTQVKSFCFNCGDKDHTIWECTKPKNEDGHLPFATCFLCGQTGHLVSKCQQNTSGVYPQGGGCHKCSSPYHLMKDCPTHATTKHSNQDEKKPRIHKTGNDDDNDSYWT